MTNPPRYVMVVSDGDDPEVTDWEDDIVELTKSMEEYQIEETPSAFCAIYSLVDSRVMILKEMRQK